jgi:SAM-dependent methyltransferase
MKDSFSIKEIEEYWDTRPCNIRHSTAQIGTRKYHTEVMRRRYFVEPHVLNWIHSIPGYFNKTLDILEIGCGIGSDAFLMASEGHNVDAVDVSKKSLKVALKGKKALCLDGRLYFYYANAEKLSLVLPIREYDVIYIYGVLHHTPDQEKLLEEIKKYMGKDSILKLMVYNKWSWKGMVLWLRDRSFKNTEAQPNCPIARVHSKDDVKKLLKDFTIIESKIDFIFPYKVDEYIKYEYKKVWYWPILRHLQKILGWHILITAKKNV